MTEYLLINTFISLWALIISRTVNIDVTFKFFSLVFALISWTVPYGLLVFQNSLPIIEQTAPWVSPVKNPVITILNQSASNTFSWKLLLMTLLGIGLIMFVIDMIKLYQQHHYYLKHGQTTSINGIYTIKDLNNACVTGIISPKIWIDENLYHSKLGISIIAHERQHIKLNDPYWLILITLFYRLFWFNPVMWLLIAQCRFVLESRCDMAAEKQFKPGEYQSQLAQILLRINQKQSNIINHMSLSSKNNIQRIKQLSKDRKMQNLTKLTVLFSILIVTFFSAVVLAKNTEDSSQNIDPDDVVMSINWVEHSNKGGIKQSTTLDSEIIVNKQTYKEFELVENKIKVKAQLANKGEKPEFYFIETIILSNHQYPVSEPKFLAEKGKPTTIRILNEEPASHRNSLELTFTVKENTSLGD